VRRVVLFMGILLCTSCSGPTKAGKEARALAHQRMAIVNADLAAQQAKQQFEVGQLDAAITTINGAIARYGKNGDYHLLRGRILLEQHRLDAAFQSLESAIEHIPHLAEPYYFLGVLHQRWGEDSKALEAYELAMKNDPHHPQYLLATAESHVALHQLDDAIQLLMEAKQEFQHHPSVSSLLGQIYLTKGDPTQAAIWFEDSRLLGNDNNETLTSLINAQFQAGQYADCLSTLSIFANEEDSLSPTFRRIRGKCLAATGRLIEGRDICLRVTRETPDDAGAWADLGYISWEMGDYRRLGRCGEHVSQLDSSLPEGPLFEGIAAIHAGNEELAKEKLKSLESYNTFHGIEELLHIYAKNTKLDLETPLHLDSRVKTAEGLSEQHSQELVEGSQPVASVSSDSPDAP